MIEVVAVLLFCIMVIAVVCIRCHHEYKMARLIIDYDISSKKAKAISDICHKLVIKLHPFKSN